MRRSLRWISLTLCIGFLVHNIFGETQTWSLAGFFATGALWYWLTWKRTRELDGRLR